MYLDPFSQFHYVKINISNKKSCKFTIIQLLLLEPIYYIGKHAVLDICVYRKQGELSHGWSSCGLRDPGNPLHHWHRAILLQVQMQEVEKVLQEKKYDS